MPLKSIKNVYNNQWHKKSILEKQKGHILLSRSGFGPGTSEKVDLGPWKMDSISKFIALFKNFEIFKGADFKSFNF